MSTSKHAARLRHGPALLVIALACESLSACGGAPRARPPQSSVAGKAQLTAASLGKRVEKVLVADREEIAMVGRSGCHATVLSAGEGASGPSDELRVRCPRKERLATWFGGLDRLLVSVELVEAEEDAEEPGLPAAELVTSGGKVMRVVRPEDAARLVSEVRAFGAELAASEIPTPGPATEAGWQGVRVMGAAHVMLGGEPTRGVLDARMSTSGQYFCEFVATTDEGPVRATKSGWITPTLASRAVDEVLMPFQGLSRGERSASTFASAMSARGETRANSASTAAVFERFAPLQDALGDACLPELEPPAAAGL